VISEIIIIIVGLSQ